MENSKSGLTTDGIKSLHTTIFNAKEAQSDGSLLEYDKLDSAPKPSDIKDRFISVLGDAFHLMDRTKVSVHKAKKSFFVAL